MAIFAVFLIIVLFFVSYDHICYWRCLDNFEFKAYELSAMYEFLVPKVINGDPDWPDVEEFMFNGDYYYVKVFKGDLKTLYTELNIYIKNVLDSYEEIERYYLSVMDYETLNKIEELHGIVQEISNKVRYQMWLQGIK